MVDTDLTSDILIYNILKKSKDPLIQKNNIRFIDKSVPAMENNTIYIANIDLENNRELFDGTEYRALVNVFVKTKNTNYLKGSRYLRTVVKHIKNELKNHPECKERNIKFRNINYEYGGVYTLKGLHLLIQLLEYESDSIDDYSCVKLDDDFEVITE